MDGLVQTPKVFSETSGGYYIWTIGCQMNKADSERLGSALDQLGFHEVSSPDNAQIVVLNSCVVRQNAEDRVSGVLSSMKPIREGNPSRILALMGCMVGPNSQQLKNRFPYVDTFMRPQDYTPLFNLLEERMGIDWEACLTSLIPTNPKISAFVPIIHGCDLMCTFCIIPFRRGRQKSRPIPVLFEEIQTLTERGVQEVTLLGQTVDAYGSDLPDKPDLADLMDSIHGISSLKRIRFLTSHPIYMTSRIINSIKTLPKVCKHINLPIQAGNDKVLELMRRRYTRNEYYNLISDIRNQIPEVSLSTDIIVGFPGETDEAFQDTLETLSDIKFDKVHVAAYSPREGTFAWNRMEDSVPWAEKQERLHLVESLQKRIGTELNAKLLGANLEILVEDSVNGKWRGRTKNDKLVFFHDESNNHQGELVNVTITKTSPWSLQGSLKAI